MTALQTIPKATAPPASSDRNRVRLVAGFVLYFERLLDWLYRSPNPTVRWYTERNPMAHGSMIVPNQPSEKAHVANRVGNGTSVVPSRLLGADDTNSRHVSL